MYLNVPYVTQLEFGQDNNLNDPTGCWYASACMIGYAYGAGPRLGAPALFSRPITHKDGSAGTGHWGLPVEWYETFIKNENLVKVDGGLPNTGQAIQVILNKWGPMLVFWEKTNSGGHTYGHACVLIGATENDVIIHDPENEPNKTIALSTFRPLFDKYNPWWPIARHDAPDFSFKGGKVG